MRAAGALRGWPVWIAVVPVAIWALVRTLGLEGGQAVPLLAFTPYVALASLPLAGLALAFRNWPAAVLGGAAALCLAVAVLPRAIDRADAVPSSGDGATRIDVLSSNVYFGRGDARQLRDLVERLHIDLLTVQELTPQFDRELRAAGIGRLLPHSVIRVEDGASGGGIYSRWPARELAPGVEYGFRQPRAELRLPGSQRIRVADVHPYVPTGSPRRWEDSLDGLPSTGGGAPWILAGDFNATLDHAVLRDVISRGYRDAGAVAGSGLVPTWPEGRTLPPLITIDHILADERLEIADYGTEAIDGSDHRAVWAQLRLPLEP